MSTTNSAPLFLLNPDREELFIGVLYSALAFWALPIHVIVLYIQVMTKDSIVRSNLHYRLMYQINCADFFQTIFHMLSGIYIIFPQIQAKYQFLVRVTGCTTNSLWLATFPIIGILSLIRILTIFKKISQVHPPKTVNVLIWMGWLYTIVVWLWGCITQNMFMEGVGWSYDYSKFGANTMNDLELYLCFPSLAITYLAYLLIIIHVFATKMSSPHGSHVYEIRLFIQSTIICVYMAILIAMWHNAESWFVMTNAKTAVLNCAWICSAHLNPILLVTLNRTIQMKVKELVIDKTRQATKHKNSLASKQFMLRSCKEMAPSTP